MGRPNAKNDFADDYIHPPLKFILKWAVYLQF